jgi:hypothetical protein
MERKNNSGVLKQNKRREKETHPHLKGGVTVDGVEYWISAWKRTNQDGEVEFSLSFQAKQENVQNVNLPGFNDNDVRDMLENL